MYLLGDVEDNLLTVVIDNEESTLEFVDFSEDKVRSLFNLSTNFMTV